MTENKRIIRVLVVICLLFLTLLVYLLYFNMFRADEVAANPYNKRQWEDEKFVKRGSIYDANGTLLAETQIAEDGTHSRVYPKGRLYSHIIGYHSKAYGKSQLEMKYDAQLLGKGDISLTFNELRSGYDLNLTIDNVLQQYAYDQLGARNGAVVALEPKTGKILAMVSRPDFEPSAAALEKNWKDIVEREDSPLLSRATQGLYPPGSTFKIATTAAAYEQGKTGAVFEDTGLFEVGGIKVKNSNNAVHGRLSLQRGFEVSSNFVFCTLGYELGAENMLDISKRFGVDKDIKLEVNTSKSQIQYKKMSDVDAALVAIGQGQLLMTPLHVALMGSVIANDGRMMQPYLVDSVTTASGITVSRSTPQMLYDVISPGCAEYIKNLMVGAVKNGTGTNARISGIEVAGKTGTAENETSKDHAWFVGFAPADNPEIVVAVILEYDGGGGGSNAAPIARNVMKKYLKK